MKEHCKDETCCDEHPCCKCSPKADVATAEPANTPDEFGLISEDGQGARHPTRPAKARVAVGLSGSSVLMDIDLPDDYKECAGAASGVAI